jgi:hypothetical protein
MLFCAFCAFWRLQFSLNCSKSGEPQRCEKGEFSPCFQRFLIGGAGKKSSQKLPVLLYWWASMQRQTTSVPRPWPTLAGRLSQPLTSRVEAVRQLQATMPITPVAQNMLKKSNGGSSSGPKKTGS